MIRLILVFGLLVLGFSGQIAEAHESDFEINLGKNRIDITTGFAGETLEIYGVKAKGDDVIIVVKGPDRDIMVQRKDHIMGGWINRLQVVFEDVPSFYRVAASKEIELMSDVAFLREHEIGSAYLDYPSKTDGLSAADLEAFKQALVRNKSAEGLFSAKWNSIDILEDQFYRTSFYFPHNVPIGAYKVMAYTFHNQHLSAQHSEDFLVKKVGFSAQVYEFSKKSPFWYGLLCVFLALYSGWLSHKLKPKFKSK
jgi:uncharacterized protein (TIGR02186 family)